MTMTREEAIKVLNNFPIDFRNSGGFEAMEALKIAILALRPVSREQVEKAWMGCKYCDEEWGTCNPITNRFVMPPRGGIQYCPMCGKPLTDEAVEMVMERLEEMRNG